VPVFGHSVYEFVCQVCLHCYVRVLRTDCWYYHRCTP